MLSEICFFKFFVQKAEKTRTIAATLIKKCFFLHPEAGQGLPFLPFFLSVNMILPLKSSQSENILVVKFEQQTLFGNKHGK